MLLRKHDAQIISKNFPNIWRRIQNKFFHNLVSIKNLTFKILKQYYNTHLSNKNNKDKSVNLNLDVTRNSVNDNSNIMKQSFSGAVAQLKKERNVKFSPNANNKNINTNKLHIQFKPKRGSNSLSRSKSRSKSKSKRKISEDTFGNELNYSYESGKSNSVNNSQFKLLFPL